MTCWPSAAAALFGRLEDELQPALPGARRGLRGQFRGRAEQAGDVHVVPAGVHHRDVGAVRVLRPDGGGVVQAGLLEHRQRVHVGPQQHRGPGAGLEHADHAGAADPGGHLVAEIPQSFRDDARGPVLGERQLGMGVQVAVERG
jgi:hypothetical protein